MARPTIYDVAEAAGVSKSLVSLVLRGSNRVSDASRAAVEVAIAELGYRPNRAATDLAAARTMLVGVLIDDFANPWFVDLLRGISQVLSPAGYRLSVLDNTSMQDSIDAILSMRADGVVVARDVPVELMMEGAPPVVVAGTREDIPPEVDVVANDDEFGGRMAAEHLLALGHRCVAHIGAGGGAAAARRRAFDAAMRSAGGEVVCTDYTGPATESAGFDTSIQILRTHPDVTALFAANDVMAIGAMGAARELGRSVPGEVSIIGYDDTFLARTRLISLTTIDDSGFAVGHEAAQLLLSRMSGEAGPAVRRTLDPALVVRGTTAPLNGV
jgi:Transcriptional regulators